MRTQRHSRRPTDFWGRNTPVVLKVVVVAIVAIIILVPLPDKPLKAISVLFGLDAVKMVLEREVP